MGGFGGGGFQDMFGRRFQSHQPQVDFFEANDIIEIDMKSLSQFYRRRNVWLILFFKPDEDASLKIKDLWQDLASRLYGIITVAGVNCNNNDMICDDFEAYGCPAIFIAKANIEERHFSDTSMMPDDVLNSLEKEEILDLLAYLVADGDPTHRIFQAEDP